MLVFRYKKFRDEYFENLKREPTDFLKRNFEKLDGLEVLPCNIKDQDPFLLWFAVPLITRGSEILFQKQVFLVDEKHNFPEGNIKPTLYLRWCQETDYSKIERFTREVIINLAHDEDIKSFEIADIKKITDQHYSTNRKIILDSLSNFCDSGIISYMNGIFYKVR